ncbi:MAG: TVP38/TMEM64 family protein [Microcystis aeruginosa G13-10]|nr:TVP38/TMEM64 family protein [Microcystis aeruginosa G13-10]
MIISQSSNWKKLVICRYLPLLITFSGTFLLTTPPAFALESSASTGFNPQTILFDALTWVDSLGAVGAIAFIIIYILATVAFFPGSILTFGAGVVFGVVLGSFYVFIGANIGATAAFLVGRYEAVGREGLKIVLLTRLSPVFPFNLLNYAYGVTGVSLKDYLLGSAGMIPGTIMYVYIGSLAGNLATIGTSAPATNPVLQWTIRLIGFIATVAVTLYVTKIARQALASVISE